MLFSTTFFIYFDRKLQNDCLYGKKLNKNSRNSIIQTKPLNVNLIFREESTKKDEILYNFSKTTNLII